MTVRPCALITRLSNNQTEVLLMHYRYGEADVFALPGGNPDRGETLPETVVREVHEELGVSITVDEMILAGEMLLSERANDVLHLVFATHNLHGKPVLNPAETSALAVQWISISDLGNLNMYPNIGKQIQQWWESATSLGYIGRIQQRYFG